MTISRLRQIESKCASVGGITREERSEWHRLLVEQIDWPGMQWTWDEAQRLRALNGGKPPFVANRVFLSPSECAREVDRVMGNG